MPYPNYTDILSYCQAFGIDCPAQTFVDDFINESIEEWHDEVGYEFYGAGISTTKYNSPINDSLFIPPYQTFSSLSLNDNVLTQNQDYFIEPWGIRFPGFVCGGYNDVSIEGIIGYNSIPVRVKMLIIKMVIWKIITINPTRQIKSVKMSDQTVDFDKWIDYSEDLIRLRMEYQF